MASELTLANSDLTQSNSELSREVERLRAALAERRVGGNPVAALRRALTERKTNEAPPPNS